MVRIRADWVRREAGKEVDGYLRQRAWHWMVRRNYALAADYAIRLLNRHPKDPLGLVIGRISGASTNQDVFAQKCVEAQQRLCFVKDVPSVVDLVDAERRRNERFALPLQAEVAALVADFEAENAARAAAGTVATGLENEQLTVLESEPLVPETQAAVRRSSLRVSSGGGGGAPLTEALEPKGGIYGRGLYATRRLPPRTAILIDQPLMVQRMDENRCAHCLAPLQGGTNTTSSTGGEVSCEHCSEETYCGVQCREAAWAQSHACCCRSVNPGFADWAAAMKEALYSGGSRSDSTSGGGSPEDAAGSQSRAALSCLAVSKLCTMATVQQVHPLALNGVRGLRGVADYEPATALSEIGALAVTLSAALHQSFLYMEEVLSLFALLQTNEFLLTGGIALYPVFSLLNHSCDPNCAIVGGGSGVDAHDTRRTLVSLRDIRDGEQLFIDYNTHLTSKLGYEERKALCSQRHFECFCAKCVRRQ